MEMKKKTNEKHDSFRGNLIADAFAKKFIGSKYYTDIYLPNKDKIIIGIRDGYINLYYNCDSLAKINVENNPNMLASINKYYLGKSSVNADELAKDFAIAMRNSDQRHKEEKQAQATLYLDNNQNSDSNWFCIDVEYTKSFAAKNGMEGWRFDIIAVSKQLPIKVALIELKYGNKAIGGTSGIRTHVTDFYNFTQMNEDGKRPYDILLPEICSIIKGLKLLGVAVPPQIAEAKIKDFAAVPQFYFITLNNNPIKSGASTPKQTMSGYLFRDERWKCNRVSNLVKKEGDYFDIINHDKSFLPTFLFGEQTLPKLGIRDILDESYYDKEIITQ